MKTTRLFAFLTGVLFIGACDKSGDGAIQAPNPPMAYTRFVNAVADTGPTDWRFVDQLEYSPIGLGLRFRDFSPYQQTAPGARHLKVFPTSTDINVTQQHFQDLTITFEAGKHYTIILHGYSRAGSTPEDAILVLEDVIPDIGAGNVAVRAVNLATGLGSQDVFATATVGAALPASPLFSNIGFLGASAYSTQATGALVFNATNSGTTTINAAFAAPVGAAKDVTNGLTAIGGTSIEKSVLTGFIFPRSVAGSQAPQSTTAPSFQAPSIIYLVDKHPQ